MCQCGLLELAGAVGGGGPDARCCGTVGACVVVTCALNVSAAFRHPIQPSSHLARHNARIHENQSPVAFLVSNIIVSDSSKVFRPQSLPYWIEILEGPLADQIR